MLPKFVYIFKRIYLFKAFLSKSKHRPIQYFNRFFDIYPFAELIIINLFIHFVRTFIINRVNLLLNNFLYFSRFLLFSGNKKIKYLWKLSLDTKFFQSYIFNSFKYICFIQIDLLNNLLNNFITVINYIFINFFFLFKYIIYYILTNVVFSIYFILLFLV